MSDKTPSERQQLAQRIATFICENHLANPFGGEVDQAKRYYSVALSVPRLLDGEVRVYGPKFIQLTLQGPLARVGTNFVFETEQHALDFLRLWLVEHNDDAALAIPTKQQKAS